MLPEVRAWLIRKGAGEIGIYKGAFPIVEREDWMSASCLTRISAKAEVTSGDIAYLVGGSITGRISSVDRPDFMRLSVSSNFTTR